ncbi:MAG: glycosyltransferase family 9 protein [Candidatus Didemnitutus sp.]|nr:glycosyltransferase family 9 protein [Candidatus Didemnitutus sp.]
MHLGLFKTNYLGDNVVFLPVVQELRRRYPDWRLTLVTAPRVAELFAADVAEADRRAIEPEAMRRLWRTPWRFARWAADLRARKFDASLVGYDQSSSAHALAWVAGGRVRVGGAGLRIRLQGTLTRGVTHQPGWSIAQWNWEIARAGLGDLGCKDWPATPPVPDLRHLGGGVTREPRRVIIHPGSKWHYTQWPVERYAELAGRLARDHEVLWIRAPEVAAVPLPDGVREIAPAGLDALVRTLASAALFVGNNSGPMHVASALGTPLVAITGPTDFPWDPSWHRERATVLRWPALECQPCDRVQYAPGRCARATEPLACLRRWSVDAIEAACRVRRAEGA